MYTDSLLGFGNAPVCICWITSTHHTCVTCARLWRVSSIWEWGGFIVAIGGRSHVVPLHPDCSGITLWNVSIFEVFLQPGGDYALHCIRHSTDQARLLQGAKETISI